MGIYEGRLTKLQFRRTIDNFIGSRKILREVSKVNAERIFPLVSIFLEHSLKEDQTAVTVMHGEGAVVACCNRLLL